MRVGDVCPRRTAFDELESAALCYLACLCRTSKLNSLIVLAEYRQIMTRNPPSPTNIASKPETMYISSHCVGSISPTAKSLDANEKNAMYLGEIMTVEH